MSTRTITIAEVLDLAVQRLPRLRRGVTKMRLRNPMYREHLLAELRLHASTDTECFALMGQPFADSLSDASIGDATPFAIDLDKLDQLITLFMKWLPKILELVDLLKLFTLVAFLLLSVPTPAAAQCANGQCVLRAAARIVAAPVNVVSSVPRYASVSTVSGYGSAGSSSSYGSAGSQAASRWRVGDRFRANKASRAASYGSTGSGYGSSGSMLVVPVAASPDCTCVDCKCKSAPAVPMPAPTEQTYVPQFALPVERYAVR